MESICQGNSTGGSILYKHELQEGYIRLIRLLPFKEAGEHITCSLFETSLTDAPAWEALSYMWGDTNNLTTISINGIETPIRKNLWDALKHLRGPNERIFWIDALCINQENVNERNHQVKQMKRIYESSIRVIVWLGLKSENSDMALSFITAVGRNSRIDILKIAEQLGAVKQLLARPYWKRLWIIQEVGVATRIRIHCGETYTTWNHFSKFRKAYVFNHSGNPFHLEKMFKLDLAGFEELTTVFWLDKMRESYQARTTRLNTLLEMFERAKCTDVRDKIFGLVGLANDGGDVVVDYSKTPLDLFVDLLLRCQKQDSRNSIISYARFLQRLFLDEISTPPIDSPYSSELSMMAEVDEISTISLLENIPAWERLKSKDQYSEDNLKLLELEGSNSSTVWEIADSIAYAIKDDKFRKELPPKAPIGDKNKVSKPTPISRTPKRTNLMHNSQPIPETASSTISTFIKPNPLLFTNEIGHIGIVPSNARISDTICRMELGPNRCVVVVIRKFGDRYMIIGRGIFPDILGGPMERETKGRFILHLDTRTLQLLTMSTRA